MKVFCLFFLVCLFSCNEDYSKAVKSEPQRWKRYNLYVPEASGSLTAFDAVQDGQRSWHIALIMRVTDEDAQSSYQLMYFTNKSGSWQGRVLKSSRYVFQLVRGGNNANNFLRILIDPSGDPVMFYTTFDFKLIRIDPLGNEQQLFSRIASFTAVFDSQNKLHIAAEDSDYASNTIHHHVCTSSCSVTSYTGTMLGHINPLHMEIVFHGNEALIFTKAQKFLVLRGGTIYTMLMGDGVGSVFNVYQKGDVFKTCYQNPNNERFELYLDPVTMTITRKKLPFRSNYQMPTNCLITESGRYSFIGYYNYQPYNNDLMIYSHKSGNELLERIGVEEIKLMKLLDGAILVGGLDEDTLQPVLHEFR